MICFALTTRQGLQEFFTMIRPQRVEAISGFRIKVAYPDGKEGIIDLSADMGRGVFVPLADEAFFQTVHNGRYGQIAWSEDIEICPDSAYQEISGRTTVGVLNS
jgi:hypothetical protein